MRSCSWCCRGKSTGHDIDLLISHPVEGEEKGLLQQLLHRLGRKGMILYGKWQDNTFTTDVSIGSERVNVKVKVCVYSPDIPCSFSRLYINYPKVLELTLSQSHLPGETAAQFSAALANHTVLIFVPPGTHYCWVDRGVVDSNLAQGFYT